jgi:hypothetical protein
MKLNFKDGAQSRSFLQLSPEYFLTTKENVSMALDDRRLVRSDSQICRTSITRFSRINQRKSVLHHPHSQQYTENIDRGFKWPKVGINLNVIQQHQPLIHSFFSWERAGDYCPAFLGFL